MSKGILFLDTETYRNFHYIGFKRLSDGKRIGFEFSDRANFDRDHVRNLMRKYTTVGFNSLSYDLPILYLALGGASNVMLKEASDRIIKGGLKWWEVERSLGIRIPNIDHIDLIEPNPAVMQGLKILNGRLHGDRLQDLPYDPDIELTHEQMDKTADYCLVSDLDATENVYNALREPLALRVTLGEQMGMDFRSKSDAQIGETMIKTRVEKLSGRKVKRISGVAGTTFKYDVPDFVKFETKELQNVLEIIKQTTFVVKADGKVDFPKEFRKLNLSIGASVYTMGIGGLHSNESNRSIHTDEDNILIEGDVASQYPNIIKKLGLYPKALGRHFNQVYNSILAERLIAKRTKDKVKDASLKIALNGAYGKLGSRYSVLYAPHLLVSVTLTGQLSLLMLIERAESNGISVVSGNTDGVIFRCPRNLQDGFVEVDGRITDRLKPSPLEEIVTWWEGVTGFELECSEYASVYNQSVNSYFAISPGGKVKRKGPNANPWSDRAGENDLRVQMTKNPQMTICSDAALEHILTGKPVEQTIRESRDIKKFVTLTNVGGGGTWRDEYLGKVVRYIWSTDGDPIIKVKPHPKTGNRPKVSKSDGARPVMNLPKQFPDDIDYERYIEEAYKILKDLGFYNRESGYSVSKFESFFIGILNGTSGVACS